MRQWPRFDISAWRVWDRNFIAWLKYYKTSLLLNFGEPLMNLLALGFGLGAYVTKLNNMPFAEFIAPGLLASTAMMGVAYDTAFSGHAMLDRGVFESMVTGPLQVNSIAGGMYLWEAARSVLYGCTFLLVILVMGLVHSPLALLIPLLMVASGFLFTAPSLYVAAWAKAEDQLFYYFTLFITPMFMFSGIFFPVSNLPAAARWLIWLSPLYHITNLSRALVLGRLYPGLWVDVVWLLVVTIALLPLPVARLRRRLTV
ncbi:MAG: ABC transporter permease [Symbiobacteriia bacterium]